MAEHDYVIANQNGANTRSDLNNALAAIVSNNSKATAPTTTYAFMWWADTANDILKQRNAADSAWISILTLSTGLAIGVADNAITLAKMAGGTDGELITYDTSGNPTTVPVGTSAQVLTSNGAGATPTFQDAAGNNTPSFSVRLSSNQSIPSGAYTKIVFDSENWDTNSAFASGTFTVPSGQAGKYLFTFHCSIGLLDSTKTVLARLYVNGANYQYAHNSVVSDSANWGAFVLTTAVINLSVGHTVEAYCYQNNGTNLDALATGNEFSGFKLIGV